MSENKNTKYFKYAIGEIVLVVIGILIALQINTWNTNHQDSKKEQKYLLNLKTDLQNQIEEIDAQFANEKRVLVNTKLIIDKFNKEKKFKVDSTLLVYSSWIGDRRTFKTKNPTFTQLVNSGEMKLIANESFRNNLVVFQQNLERIKNIIILNNSYFVDDEAGPKLRELVPVYWPDPYGYSNSLTKQIPYEGNVSRKKLKELILIGQQQLNDKKTLMHFINLVMARYGHAWHHMQLMQKKKEEAQVLLEELNKLID